MLVGLSILFTALFTFLSVSIGKFTGRLAFYTTQLDIRTDELQSLLESLGISNLDLREVVDPDAIVGALGSVLSGLGIFLSNLFLILMITLFLLGEGPAMVARLRASAAPDNPQLARLTVVGRGVIRQLGLRAITNFVIGAGITVLFWVLGVDFPPLWGVLAFFLIYRALYRPADCGSARGALGPGRVWREPGGPGHLGDDSNQPAGGVRARPVSPEQGSAAVPRGCLPFLHLLGLASRCAGSLSGDADHTAAGRNVRYLLRDTLACQPHDDQSGHRLSCPQRGGRAHRMNARAQARTKAADERRSSALSCG
jgi:hypothetical protein